MHGGLSRGGRWVEVNVTLLEPLPVLWVGERRAVGIEGPPELPVINEESRLVLALHVVVINRMLLPLPGCLCCERV